MSLFIARQYARGAAANFGYWRPAQPPVDHRPAADAGLHLTAPTEAITLWTYLFRAWPDWSHGQQGTGDCVSWAVAHRVDVLLAVARRPSPALCATEAIYGFARVEHYGRPDYGGPGTYGAAAAAAIAEYGTLYRIAYDRHDLSRYDGRRAVEWGRTGVPDELEPPAAQHTAADTLKITTVDEAAGMIARGYPVDYCGRTTWPTVRGRDGLGIRWASGAHAMTLTGWRPDPPAFWCANTGHGRHVSGPTGPYPVPAIYAECGGWIPADRVARVLAAGDCFATSMIDGFPDLLADLGSDYLAE